MRINGLALDWWVASARTCELLLSPMTTNLLATLEVSSRKMLSVWEIASEQSRARFKEFEHPTNSRLSSHCIILVRAAHSIGPESAYFDLALFAFFAAS